MKKMLLYLLLSVMMLGNTTFHQLSKIHFLLEHYQQHHRINQDLSLIGFLEMHYWGKDLPDKDDEQDNQLPFKRLANHFHYDFYHPSVQVTIDLAIPWSQPVHGLPKPHDLPETTLNQLRRPPRIHNLI